MFIHSPIGTSGIRLLGKCSGLSVGPRYVVKSSVLEVDDRDLGIAFESEVFDAVFTRFEAFDSTFRGHAATFAVYQPKRLDHCQIVATPAKNYSMTGLEIAYSSDDPVSVTNTIVNQGVTVNLGAAFLALPNPPVTEGNIFRLGSSTYLLTMMGGTSGQTYQFGPNYFDYSGDINAVILDGKADVTRPFADISKRLSLPPAAGPRVKDLDGDGVFDDVDPNPLMPSP